jgi:predicted nucleic acid-binding protein
MSVLVDSNVLIDVMQGGAWADWSTQALARVADREPVAINQIIYAEVAVGFVSVEALDEALTQTLIEREDLPWQAGFIAARAFLAYRRRGGARSSPLPDFYIGAHALTAGHKLLTRDTARYRSYFPNLELIAPNEA